MRLPNGFGSIVKKSGNRRRPYEIRKWADGKQKVIGYESTYESALAFLCEYNRNPLLYSPATITFSELFALLKASLYPKIKENTQKSYSAVYRHLKRLYDKPFAKIRIGDLQRTIQDIRDKGIGYSTQKKARQVLHHMYTYAVRYEIIAPEKDISRYIDIDKNQPIYQKKIFTTRQINRLFRAKDMPFAKIILIHICLGVRPSELLDIKASDIKLKKGYLRIRESKTEARRNRIIPLHREIIPFIKALLEQGGVYLISSV